MEEARRPLVGTLIDYTFATKTGIMEIIKTTHDKIYFHDHYNGKERYDYVIDFRWSTWDVHTNSTLTITAVRTPTPDWEV